MHTQYFHHPEINSIADLNARLHKLVQHTLHAYFQLDSDHRSAKLSYDHWSPREIIGHLTDSARYNLMRFTEIPLESSPYVIKVYDQVNLVKIFNYQHQDDAALLQFWQNLNLQISRIISQLTPEELGKKVSLGEESFTLSYIIFDYVGHLEHHLEQIFGQMEF